VVVCCLVYGVEVKESSYTVGKGNFAHQECTRDQLLVPYYLQLILVTLLGVVVMETGVSSLSTESHQVVL
jgi:hypothetical protein